MSHPMLKKHNGATLPAARCVSFYARAQIVATVSVFCWHAVELLSGRDGFGYGAETKHVKLFD